MTVARHIESTTDAQPASKAPDSRVYHLAIMALALTLRLAMMLSIAKGDPRYWFFNQASEYGCLAQSMISGHGYASPFGGSTGPSAFLAPGYPLLVAGAFQIFGAYSAHAAVALLSMQLVFAELTLLVLMMLAKRVLGGRTANLAGVLWAVSPPALALPALFWETSLSMLLLTGVMLLAISCADHLGHRCWATLGLYSALAMLVNPSLFPTFVLVLLWTAWRVKRRSGWVPRGPLLALVVWGAVYSVWPIRNQVQMHAFVPFRTNMGYELWQGNRPGSDGTFDLSLHPNASKQEYARYAELGEVAYMREKTKLAFEAIAADKLRFVRLSLSRFARFWMNVRGQDLSWLLSANLGFTSLMSLAGLGTMLWRREPLGVLLAIPFLVLPAPYYLTHADLRFRLLLDPLAMLLTAYGVQWLLGNARSAWLATRLRDDTLAAGV